MTQNADTTAISTIADYSAMLVAPTVPANVLERESAQLMKLAAEHGLNEEAAEMVAFIHREFGASMGKVGTYLALGHKTDAIVNAYEARALFDEAFGAAGVPSIGSIIEAAGYFIEGDDPVHFQELLLELQRVYPELKHSDTVVKVALEEAKAQEVVYLGDLIDSRR